MFTVPKQRPTNTD